MLILSLSGSSMDQKKVIPFPSAVKAAGVSLSDLKDGQKQGLILGNGDLYGIVMEMDGNLFMRITKNDIWDARIDLSEDGAMPKVDIAGNKISGTIGGPPSYGKIYPQPRCAALPGSLTPLPKRSTPTSAQKATAR